MREEAANLREPLSTLAEIGFGRGSERAPRPDRPARMRALHSSAALVANVFDYWSGRDAGPLLLALGERKERAAVAFEEPLPTGSKASRQPRTFSSRPNPGTPSRSKASSASGSSAGRATRPSSRRSTFHATRGSGSAAACSAARRSPEALQSGAQRFRHLHAAQLLKHALGLARARRGAFTLCYLYYDWPMRESESIAPRSSDSRAPSRRKYRFARSTYQKLFGALGADGGVDRGYVEYLRDRYFPDLALALRAPPGATSDGVAVPR